MSPGRISASLAPRRARISVANAGWTNWSLVACSVIASMTRRSPWPMLTDISWLLKSRIRLALGRVQVDALGVVDRRSGRAAPCTDHENRVCARESATISSLVMPGAVLMPIGPPFRATAGRPEPRHESGSGVACRRSQSARRRPVSRSGHYSTRPRPTERRAAGRAGYAVRTSSATRRMTASEASTSASVVDQPLTEMRIARRPCQRRPAQPQRAVAPGPRRSRRRCARRRPRRRQTGRRSGRGPG